MSTTAAAVRWTCTACGSAAPAEAPGPFRCARAGRDDLDHVLVRRLEGAPGRFVHPGSAHPFLRHRELLSAWRELAAAGEADAFAPLVERLDAAIAAVDGHGFAVTPFRRSEVLSERFGFAAGGGVWVKDETGNVGGSHKARHLMGVALWLDALERLGRLPPPRMAPPLAIASCGNAALAGAIVARAAGRRLRVFVPEEADPGVLARLGALGAEIQTCRRAPGPAAPPGDPSLAAFRDAVARGAIPFTCQGSECGLAIEGGETIAWEMAGALAESGITLDRLFVQVGGGALASACVQGFREARTLGVPVTMPRLHPVQGAGCAPLARAYARVRDDALRRLAAERGERAAAVAVPAASADGAGGDEPDRADALRAAAGSAAVAEALREAREHRMRYMWPWEPTPSGSATGILDDETYDWYAVTEGTLASGGFPVVVDEPLLAQAHALARSATGIRVDRTGAAGLAGLIELKRRGVVRDGERVAVLFTGVER